MRRAQTAIADTPLIQPRLTNPKYREMWDLALTLLAELKLPRRGWTKLSDQARSILSTRVPCHRDLTSDHVLFSLDPQPDTPTLSTPIRVLDWGQSRLDCWTSDWVKLYVELRNQPQIWESAWRGYWDTRSSHLTRSECTVLEHQALSDFKGALALQAVNTLRWSMRHRLSEPHITHAVWSRGIEELSTLMTL